MKTFLIVWARMPDHPCLAVAETAGKARYQAYLSIDETFDEEIHFKDLKCRRFPKYDHLVEQMKSPGLIPTNLYDENELKYEMKKDSEPIRKYWICSVDDALIRYSEDKSHKTEDNQPVVRCPICLKFFEANGLKIYVDVVQLNSDMGSAS